MQTRIDTEITIRMLFDDEDLPLARLAERDSAAVPAGRLLGAFVGGELVAARSITTGAEIADPFTRTDEVRALLKGRAKQLAGRFGSTGTGRLRRLTAGLHVPHAEQPAC